MKHYLVHVGNSKRTKRYELVVFKIKSLGDYFEISPYLFLLSVKDDSLKINKLTSSLCYEGEVDVFVIKYDTKMNNGFNFKNKKKSENFLKYLEKLEINTVNIKINTTWN